MKASLPKAGDAGGVTILDHSEVRGDSLDAPGHTRRVARYRGCASLLSTFIHHFHLQVTLTMAERAGVSNLQDLLLPSDIANSTL